jgi:hypothetical protein
VVTSEVDVVNDCWVARGKKFLAPWRGVRYVNAHDFHGWDAARDLVFFDLPFGP